MNKAHVNKKRNLWLGIILMMPVIVFSVACGKKRGGGSSGTPALATGYYSMGGVCYIRSTGVQTTANLCTNAPISDGTTCRSPAGAVLDQGYCTSAGGIGTVGGIGGIGGIGLTTVRCQGVYYYETFNGYGIEFCDQRNGFCRGEELINNQGNPVLCQ